MFAITSIPADANRGWKVLVDGAEVQAGTVEIVSGRYGRITYGWRPEGFDSWVYTMQRNAVTLPYSVVEIDSKPELVVGLLTEDRPNMGGKVLCVIGGFTDPGETIEEARRREADEEAGLVGKAKQIGDTMVTDRLFWNASTQDIGGNVPFAQRISPKALVQTEPHEWRVKQGEAAFQDFKKALLLRFYRWNDAVDRSNDGIALAALARLKAAFDRGEL
jgi:8-oxo-dGTP pyrophosphatase MutT (NUDIX family)